MNLNELDSVRRSANGPQINASPLIAPSQQQQQQQQKLIIISF